MENCKTVLHFGNLGDCLASLAAVKEYSRITGKKIIYYMAKDRIARYYPGAVHPTLDDKGNMVMLNKAMIDMLIPLLNAQPYIQEGKHWKGEQIDVDLNKIRETTMNQGAGMLSRWYFKNFPNLICDVSKKYIDIPSTKKNIARGKIIVNRTERYNNQLISYFFLKKFKNKVIFCGTKGEYIKFCNDWDLDIPYLEVCDFLELAQALKQCRFFIGNQSMMFQLAEGAKIPRVLEVFEDCPNVIPLGGLALDATNQTALEYNVERIYNETK